MNNYGNSRKKHFRAKVWLFLLTFVPFQQLGVSFQLYLDSICIGFIHILQTLTALKSWSLLRAVLQFCNLILDKKKSDPEKKALNWTNQTCNEVFRSCLAPVHLFQNWIRIFSQRRAAAPNVCLTAGQSLKQTSRKQSESGYNRVRVQAHQRQCFHHRGLLLELASECFRPPRSRLSSIPSLKWSGRLRG